MREIPLTQGQVAIVDDADYAMLAVMQWHAHYEPNKRAFYAVHTERRQSIRMHRLILGAPSGQLVDHVNRNPLDNRRDNLRICSHSGNARNRSANRGRRTTYKGVSWNTQKSRWHAGICCQGKHTHLGWFINEKEAARAYDAMARQLFGEFAFLNFPSSGSNLTPGESSPEYR